MNIIIVICSLLIVLIAFMCVIRAVRAEKQRDFYKEHAEIYALMIDHIGMSDKDLDELFHRVLDEVIKKGGDYDENC